LLGVDVVDIERLRSRLERSPRLARRLFTDAEREYCAGTSDPVVSLAGTLAAKEAVIKALRLGPLVAWAARIEIIREESGAPRARVQVVPPPGTVEISISHDAGVAVAVALALRS
jgi:holo-[acyl-carrier protein] synthase